MNNSFTLFAVNIAISLFFIFSSSFSVYSQFSECITGVTVNLTGASTVTDGVYAYVCGDSGTVLKTTNTGTAWINVSGNGIPANVNLVNIYAVDNNNALTAGSNGSATYVYRTSNGGLNWTQVFFQPGGFINAINIKNAPLGFMCGNPVGGRWSLWKTTNSGANWDSAGLFLPRSGSETGFNNSLFCTGIKIWFGTNNSRIYYSSNSGISWVTQSTAPETNSSAVWFYSWDTTFGSTGGDSLLKTTNSGTNWIRVTPSPGTGRFAGFTWGSIFVDNLFPPILQWYVRNDNKICESQGGFTWQIRYTAPAGVYRYVCDHYDFGPFAFVYAVRSNGGITKINTYMGGVERISSEIPENFELSQNYPNPFNPVTRIRFTIPRHDKTNIKVMLRVYDVLGNEVKDFLLNDLSPGTYEVDFDGENLPSGTYFCRLQAGKLDFTRKMILLK